MGYTPPEQNIRDPAWEILNGIEKFNKAARERILAKSEWNREHREELAAMRGQLNAIEVDLRDLIGG